MSLPVPDRDPGEAVSTKPSTARYRVYQPLGDTLARIMRRNLGAPKKGFTPRDAVRLMADHNPDVVSTADFLVMAEERAWDASKKAILFPDQDLVQRLLDARFQIAGGEGFDWPYEVAYLALPNIPALADVPGALVTWMKAKDHAPRVLRPYLKWLDFPLDAFETRSEIPEEEYAITVNYRLPGKNKDAGVVRMVASMSEIPHLIGAEDARAYLGRLSDLGRHLGASSLDLHEAETQRQLLRLVAGLALLNRMDPGLIRPGLPEVRLLKEDRPPKGSQAFRLSMPAAEREAPGQHYRRWHLRTLRDERFYRGEHAKKPRGSRVVFVRDAVVGEASPETAELSTPAKSELH